VPLELVFLHPVNLIRGMVRARVSGNVSRNVSVMSHRTVYTL